MNNTKILDLIKGMARYLSGEDGWYPYDVSLNMIQKTFHTRIHSDCEDYEVSSQSEIGSCIVLYPEMLLGV